MKLLKTYLTVFLIGFLFASCQKELNFDLTGQSEGSLKSDATTNECLPMTVNGVYKVNTAMNTDNYIEVQVNVAVVGIYTIKSDTLNGISFSGSGVFETTGIHTVRLNATGTPASEGVTSFTISYNNTICIVDVEFQPEIGNLNAEYTLGGAGGSCTGVVLSGGYVTGVALGASNTITINVNVTSPGAYNISTNTVNGVSFSATGNLGVSGNASITLTGSGTPTDPGAYYFTINTGSQTCTFSVTFTSPVNPAAFTFSGSPNDCTGAVLQGEYSVGNPTLITNTVTLSVNVTTPGSYTISTGTVNGISFFASGEFSLTGLQQVILLASGTPASSGSYNYTLAGGANSCTFSVPVENNFITCNIDGVFTTFNANATAMLDNATGIPHLSIDGSMSHSTIDPSISLQVFKANGTIIAGTYTVNQSSSGVIVSCDYNDASSANFYLATDPNNQSQTPGFTIVITSISATRCVGTFSGQVLENSGIGPAFKLIENGTFDVPLR